MKNLTQKPEIPLILKNENLNDFFNRGQEIAKRVDKKIGFLPVRTISFEDVHDLVKFLTDAKLTLVSTVRKKPFSVSGLAKQLKRSRSSLDKDIQLLESVGILKSEYIVNPGHGRQKMITAFDKTPTKVMVEARI